MHVKVILCFGVSQHIETENVTAPHSEDMSPRSPSFSSVSDLSSDMVRIFGQDKDTDADTSATESLCSESVSSATDLQSEMDRLGRDKPRGFTTFKIIGDNLDKNVKPRDMRSDFQTRSLHYFHACAVEDRIDLSGFSGDVTIPDIQSIQLCNLLPSDSDRAAMKNNFGIHIARVLVKYVTFFQKLGQKNDLRHIKHKFWKEMSQKSKVVSLYSTSCL